MTRRYVETPFLVFWRVWSLSRVLNEKPEPTLGEAWAFWLGKD